MSANDRDELQALVVQFVILTAGFLAARMSDADTGVVALLLLILLMLVLIYPMSERLRIRGDGQYEELLKQSMIASIAATTSHDAELDAGSDGSGSAAVARYEEIERFVRTQMRPEAHDLLAKEKAEIMGVLLPTGFLLYVAVLSGLSALAAWGLGYVIESLS